MSEIKFTVNDPRITNTYSGAHIMEAVNHLNQLSDQISCYC